MAGDVGMGRFLWRFGGSFSTELEKGNKKKQGGWVFKWEETTCFVCFFFGRGGSLDSQVAMTIFFIPIHN